MQVVCNVLQYAGVMLAFFGLMLGTICIVASIMDGHHGNN